MATKYTNPVSISSARRIVVQQPVDDRGQFESIAEMIDSIVNDDHYRYFEYMPTYLKELHEMCAWMDAGALPSGIDGDDLVPGTSTVYPIGYPDVQYAGKTFGFYRLRAVPSPHSHIENDISDLDKYTQAEVNALLAAKQNNLPSNGTGSVAYLTKNAADNTFSWVVLTFLTAPTNTGYGYGYQGTNWYINQDPISEPFTNASVSRHQLKIPVYVWLEGGQTYTLENPVNMEDGYNIVLLHSNTPNLDDISINGFAIDNNAIPAILGHNEGLWIGVTQNAWRRLDNIVSPLT